MEKESALNDGFATLDTIATSLATGAPVPVVVMPPIAIAPIVAAPEIAGDLDLPAVAVPAPKVDRRKGERKVQNPDGTVSYGLKADGTPRAKPGRKAKPAAI